MRRALHERHGPYHAVRVLLRRGKPRQRFHSNVCGCVTPARFVECLSSLGWTGRHVAVRLLHCDTNLPTRWSRGEAPVPELVAAWLEACVKEIVPPPVRWRARDRIKQRRVS